jgi:hypothetical protein
MRTIFSLFFAGSVMVATGATLPPLDTRCSTDADCGTVPFALSPGNDQCCYQCGQSTAGNKKWIADVNRACDAYLKASNKSCARLACVSGITATQCKAGTCVLNAP